MPRRGGSTPARPPPGRGWPPPRAVEEQWAALADPYLRARAADVRAVADQVLRALSGEGSLQPTVVDGVLVTGDLTPAQAAALDAERVRAVVLAGGSATSHASILIRSLGIPAVVAAGPEVLDIPEGTPLVVDGTAGSVLVDPGGDVLERLRAGGHPAGGACEHGTRRMLHCRPGPPTGN